MSDVNSPSSPVYCATCDQYVSAIGPWCVLYSTPGMISARQERMRILSAAIQGTRKIVSCRESVWTYELELRGFPPGYTEEA